MTDEAFERGLARRREMFGPAGAEAQLDAATDFTRPLQECITVMGICTIYRQHHRV